MCVFVHDRVLIAQAINSKVSRDIKSHGRPLAYTEPDVKSSQDKVTEFKCKLGGPSVVSAR